MDGYIYNCPAHCRIKKHCFVIKTEKEILEPLTVLKKCDAEKGRDIRIQIGGKRPP
jgi:hypothetical protein